MGVIAITFEPKRRAPIQPGLQIQQLSLQIWKLCKKCAKNYETTFYSLLIKFARSGTMNKAVIAAEIVDCPIR